MATLNDLIRKLRDQANAKIAEYNDLTEALNGVRSAASLDTEREASLVAERARVNSQLAALRSRIAQFEDEQAADEAIDALQRQSHPVNGSTRGAERVDTGGRAERATGKGYLDLKRSAAALKFDTDFNVRALLAVGSKLAPQTVLLDSPVSLGKPATSLLDVLPSRIVPGGEYSYLQQTVRTNNAAPVAVGSLKPTSVMTFTRINGTCEVVAHLSEPIHEMWLADVPSLEQFVEDELGAGVASALEDEILNGTATSPSLNGIIAGATGTQAYATSPLVTIRTGLAQFETAGLTPSAVVLAPADWLAIETATLTAGGYVLGQGTVGAPLDAIKRTLWGVPVVVSAAHTAGTALLLSEGSVGLVTDGDVRFEFGRIDKDFATNQVRGRAEVRAQVELYRPSGIIECDLTAA